MTVGVSKMSVTKNTRRTSVKRNIAVTVIYQLASMVGGLILSRYTLKTFGSEINGIIQSINQFLSYTVILECGIGGMVLAEFYKPLAYGDNEAISDIFNKTKSFFLRMSFIFLAFVAILAFGIRFAVKTDFSPVYIFTLVVILGLNNYFVYYFGLTHQLLIKADQKLYKIQTVQTLSVILNAALCITAMKMGFGIHFVKLVSLSVFLINPLFYRYYVRKHYVISDKIYDPTRTLPRKRDGMVHHMAYFIRGNTDIVLLSVFKGVKTVSVYSVYYSIVYAAENFLNAISNGISAAIGNIIAKDEKKVLDRSFDMYEGANTFITTFFCAASGVLIVPFVKMYTKGVTDANYIQPFFACLLVLAQWFYCIRIPYDNVVHAAGHYRQTKPGAYIEISINLAVSLSAVRRFGLSGVISGTLAAMSARTVYIILYLSKNLLGRKLIRLIKNPCLNFVAGALFVYTVNTFFHISSENPLLWARDAAAVCAALLVMLTVLNLITNRKMCEFFVSLIKKRLNTG